MKGICARFIKASTSSKQIAHARRRVCARTRLDNPPQHRNAHPRPRLSQRGPSNWRRVVGKSVISRSQGKVLRISGALLPRLSILAGNTRTPILLGPSKLLDPAKHPASIGVCVAARSGFRTRSLTNTRNDLRIAAMAEKDLDETVTVRFTSETRAKLEKIAEADDRPVSALVRRIVTRALENQNGVAA
jgi:hypothetical protein